MALETTKAVPLTCHGHSRPITHLSFSAPQTTPTDLSPTSPSSTTTTPPTYYLISACKDNNPMLRDGATGDWIGTFIGHKGAVWSARLSSDASLAITGSADFSARLWDTFTGECLAELGHAHIVRAVAFPGLVGRPERCATGGMEKRLRIWDLGRVGAQGAAANGVDGKAGEAWMEVGQGAHTGSIKSVVWSRHDGNILTTAADDKKIRWFDLRTPRTPIVEYGVGGLIGSCEVNDGIDGMHEGTLSVAAGKNVYLFDSGKPGTLIKHVKMDKEVASVAVSAYSRRFVTGGAGDTWVHVWDYDSEQELEIGKGHHGPVWTVSFSPDGKLYATGSEDGTIKLWKATKDAYGLWR